LDDPGGVRTGTDGARRPMNTGGAVRCAAASETVTLHHALETATLCPAGDLDASADLERIDGDLIAHRRGRLAIDLELPKDGRRCREARPLCMTDLSLSGPLLLLFPEAEL